MSPHLSESIPSSRRRRRLILHLCPSRDTCLSVFFLFLFFFFISPPDLPRLLSVCRSSFSRLPLHPFYPLFVDSGLSAPSLSSTHCREGSTFYDYSYLIYINAKYTSFLQICSNRVDERRFKAHIKFVRTSYSRLLAVCP